MPKALRILIHGASGRMGQALVRLAAEREDMVVIAAVARTSGSGNLSGAPFLPLDQLDTAPEFDVAIDFSLATGFDRILAFCDARGKALVSGTTGLSATQRAALTATARRIPVLWSANFSLGVTLLEALVERAAAVLPHWDCDIVEAHHTRKLDAPSGTALMLGAAAERAGAKPHYASLRAGDIVGEHLVQFAGIGERIELVHRATHRDVFAHGAVHAAAWLAGRPAGLYRMHDLLG